MATNKPLLTLSQVLQIQPGDDDNPAWINDFKALVQFTTFKEAKTGRKYWPLGLTDPDTGATITINMWERPLDSWNGQMCRFSGGMRMSEYNGKPEIKLGKKTLIAPMVEAVSEPYPAKGLSKGYEASTKAYKEEPLEGQSVKFKPQGQTVGMAINQACEFLRAQNKPFSSEYVWDIATQIIRISYKLENGKFYGAPTSIQTNVPPPQPQDAAQHSQTTEANEEDVPF